MFKIVKKFISWLKPFLKQALPEAIGAGVVRVLEAVFAEGNDLIVKAVDKLHETVKGIATSLGMNVDGTNLSSSEPIHDPNNPRFVVKGGPNTPSIHPNPDFVESEVNPEAEAIRNSHSKEVKEAIKAIQGLKKPLEDLVKAIKPTVVEGAGVEGAGCAPASKMPAGSNPLVPTPAEVVKSEKTGGGSDEAMAEISELDKVMTDFGQHSMGIFQDIARQGDASAKSILESFKSLALSSIFNQVIPMLFGAAPANVPGFSFGGARATGGRVYAGQSYLVGERGPEILTPDSASTITPRVTAGGGHKAEVTQNINFSTDVKNTVRAEVMNAAPHIVAEAAKAVQYNLTRGHRYI